MGAEKNFTNAKQLLGYGAIISVGLAVAATVYHKSERDFSTAKERYV